MRAILGPVLVAAFVAALWGLFLRGNPGGISDTRYSAFKNIGPPKLLYSCTSTPTREAFLSEERNCLATGRSNCDAEIDDLVKAGTKVKVDFVAGSGILTYAQLLKDARHECIKTAGNTETIEFTVLQAEQT